MPKLVFLTAIFVLALLLIILFADKGMLPDFVYDLYAFPFGDKVGHFVLMGLLSLLTNLSLSCRSISISSRNILLGSLFVFIIVTIEELTQIFFVSRSFSFLDLASSYLGVWVFGHLAISLKKSVPSPKSVYDD